MDYSVFFSYLKERVGIQKEDEKLLLSFFEPMQVKKGDILLNTGEVSKYLFFICNGTLRTYYITPDGNESTRVVALEKNFCGSLASFIQLQPSFETIEAVQDSQLLKIYQKDFYHILEVSPKMDKLYRLILEEIQIYNMWRIQSMISMSAAERYRNIKKLQPQVVERVSNKVLASYLAITPETLSRIKSQQS